MGNNQIFIRQNPINRTNEIVWWFVGGVEYCNDINNYYMFLRKLYNSNFNNLKKKEECNERSKND